MTALVSVCALAAPAGAAGPGRLSGVTVDDVGQPLAGAAVRLSDPSTGAVLAQTNASSTGAYSVSIPTGTYDLTVTQAQGASPLEARVRDIEVASATTMDVVLAVAPAPSIHLRGRVDMGIPGVAATVALAGPDSYYSSVGPDGRYDVALKPGSYRVGVSTGGSLGLGVTSVETVEITRDTTLDFSVPTSRIRVSVTDSTGFGVRAWVTIGSDGQGRTPVSIAPGIQAVPSVFAQSSTSDSGSVTIPVVATTNLRVGVYRSLTSGASIQQLQSGIDGRHDSSVVLGPPHLVSFHGTFAAPDATRLGSGTVTVAGSAGSATAPIAPDGSFSVQAPAGHYTVQLSGHSTTGAWVNLSVPYVDLSTDHGENFTAPIHFVSVHVVDGAGTAVPGASIYSSTGDGSPGGWVALASPPGASISVGTSQTADATGSATLGAAAGAPLSLTIRPPDGAPVGPSSFSLAADTSDARLVLPPGGPLTGSVRSVTGTPLAQLNVWLGADVATGSQGVTAADGTFTLQGAWGSRPFSLLRYEYPPADPASGLPDRWTVSGTVAAAAGHPLNLTLPATTTEIRTVAEDGRPMPSVMVAYTSTDHVNVGIGDFSGTTENRGDRSGSSDRMTVLSFPGSTASVYLNSLTWFHAAHVPLPANGQVVLALAVPTTPSEPPSPPTTTAAPTTAGDVGNSRPTPPRRSGYWMVGSDGTVYAFGDAHHLGNAPVGLARAVDLDPTPSGNGYWVIDDQGHVFAFGDAPSLRNVDRSRLVAGETVTSLSATPSGQGYWVFTTKGRVLTFGNAEHFGDMSGKALNGPVLDSIPTPSGQGYYMVASDGGIFAFGDAAFAGAMGGKPLNAPVQSLVPDSDGAGYWLVASDGGVFAFDAGFRGSMGDKPLNGPVTGMVPFGNGYLMVGEDGGIFNFSDREFYGSLGSNPRAQPITSVAVLDR